MIDEKQIRVFRFKYTIVKDNLDARADGPIPIYDEAKLIGFASLQEDHPCWCELACAIDYESELRLNLQNGESIWFDGFVEYRGFVNIQEKYAPSVMYIKALQVSRKPVPGQEEVKL